MHAEMMLELYENHKEAIDAVQAELGEQATRDEAIAEWCRRSRAAKEAEGRE